MRKSLASRTGARKGAPVVLQVGAPGLFVMDDPSVTAFAKAFHEALGARKQDILAYSVSGIMRSASEELNEDAYIRKLDGDGKQAREDADVRAGTGQGAGEDQQPSDRGVGGV